jgi:hypothetical protein
MRKIGVSPFHPSVVSGPAKIRIDSNLKIFYNLKWQQMKNLLEKILGKENVS